MEGKGLCRVYLLSLSAPVVQRNHMEIDLETKTLSNMCNAGNGNGGSLACARTRFSSFFFYSHVNKTRWRFLTPRNSEQKAETNCPSRKKGEEDTVLQSVRATRHTHH